MNLPDALTSLYTQRLGTLPFYLQDNKVFNPRLLPYLGFSPLMPKLKISKKGKGKGRQEKGKNRNPIYTLTKAQNKAQICEG